MGNTTLSPVLYAKVLGASGGGSVSSVNGQTGAVVLDAEDVGAEPMESITYTALKALRDGGNLIPGKQYRITDYVCTVVNDSEARAVSHPYDIIVTADTANMLNENARACLHEGDTYYSAEGAQADLSAWELKYCLDNDTSRFAWADATNGKGVVFWLKDDWNNECPYDFKQIQFKRYKITACEKSPSLVGTYLASANVSDNITKDTNDFIWAYTFTGTVDNTYVDASTLNQSFVIEGMVTLRYHCFDNRVPSYVAIGFDDGKEHLNNIVVIANMIPPHSNTFGNNCYSNTFGNGCGSNTFGNGCGANTFGNDCGSNTFGNGCGSNTFGNNCQSNTFGNDCYSNTFGNDCGSNTFGNGCGSNTFGNNCGSNTFGNDCGANTFGNGCGANTFGNGCGSNTFGNDCWSNTFATASGGSTAQSNFRNITFEDGVNYVVLYQSTTSSSAYVQNYHVLNGLQGTNNSKINVEVSTNLEYCTFVGKNTSGTVKTYNIMDGAI